MQQTMNLDKYYDPDRQRHPRFQHWDTLMERFHINRIDHNFSSYIFEITMGGLQELKVAFDLELRRMVEDELFAAARLSGSDQKMKGNETR